MFYTKLSIRDANRFHCVCSLEWEAGRALGKLSNDNATTVTTAHADLKTEETNDRTANWLNQVAPAPFHACSRPLLTWRSLLCHRSKNNNNNNKSNNDNRKGSDTSHTGQIPVRESSIVYPPSQQEDLISMVFSLHCLRLLPPPRRLSGKTLLQPAEERDIIHRRCVKSNCESWNYLFHKNKIVQNKFNLGEEF